MGEFSSLCQSVQALTLMVLTECHAPDFPVTQERVGEFFRRLEAEAFQLRRFEG